MLLGALMIARRDECARAVRGLCGTSPRWTALLAGMVAGTGLSLLIAAAWLLHIAVAPVR